MRFPLGHGAVLLALPLSVFAEAEPEAHQNVKRQDLSMLLNLASQAGVPIPTDPVALLGLGPVANQLASALPTAPVLSVLQTAAPSGFLSRIVHDPSYASSFESAFAAGSSPSWFTALPTDVKSYLHTYSGFVGAAAAAAGIANDNTTATKTGTQSGTAANATDSAGKTSTTDTSIPSGVGFSAGAPSTSSTSTTAGSAAASASASSTSKAAAAAATHGVAVGMLGVVGVLGLAVAL